MKFCILFAGAVGSSKTPIATYLSGILNLPVFNNDAIRTEVIEDFGSMNEAEYLKRRDIRIQTLLKKGIPFILDASIDRSWPELRAALEQFGYHFFIISLDLSKDFLARLHTIKGYNESIRRIDQLLIEHQQFLDASGDHINLHISDADFPNRLEFSRVAIENWLQQKTIT